uniref:Uncharacterized protein n=1 Tax=Solanum tuberosum TaxID=4113 RepID=M1BYM7_SOLTU
MGSYRELMEKANVPWRSQDVEVEGPKNIDLFSLKDALTTAKKSKTTSTTRTSQSDELVPKVPLISESPSNSEPSIIQATSVGTLQVINAKLDKILKNQEEHAQTEKVRNDTLEKLVKTIQGIKYTHRDREVLQS